MQSTHTAGTMPAAQASNVATYIAHGNVALSVLMTTASTLGAIIMTPLLTKVLAGAYVPVDAYVRALAGCHGLTMGLTTGFTVNQQHAFVIPLSYRGDVGHPVTVVPHVTRGSILLSAPFFPISHIYTYAGTLQCTHVAAPAQGLALSTFQVVLVPTLVGVLVNEFAPGFVRAIRQFLPLVGVFLTTMLCASPVGQVADVLRCVTPTAC